MGRVILDVDNVSFSYSSFNVLDKVRFGVSKGEFTGIIGPNGSGKSTLLKCISNVLNTDSGKIRFNDKGVGEYSRTELARNMAVVSQNTEITFGFTCEEIVLMGRSPYIPRFGSEQDRDYEIVRGAMRATNTLHLANRSITSISGGERQRVIIAQALAQQPKLLLLDEPTSHLDIKHQVELLDLLTRLNEKEGLTVIAVMHDLNLSALYCDYLIMLSEGQVYSIGTCEQVITAENVESVYGTSVSVTKHPITGRPQVALHTEKTYERDNNRAVEQVGSR